MLSVGRYDSSIGLLVENLYDNVLEKEPVVMLAEDTLPNLKALCDSVCKLRRRCILLVAVRTNNSLLTDYRHAEKLDMIRLTDTTVDKLRNRFQDMSRLAPVLIQQRNQDFDRVITSSMRTPSSSAYITWRKTSISTTMYVRLWTAVSREIMLT